MSFSEEQRVFIVEQYFAIPYEILECVDSLRKLFEGESNITFLTPVLLQLNPLSRERAINRDIVEFLHPDILHEIGLQQMHMKW